MVRLDGNGQPTVDSWNVAGPCSFGFCPVNYDDIEPGDQMWFGFRDADLAFGPIAGVPNVTEDLDSTWYRPQANRQRQNAPAPISVKINFTGSKSPGDNLSFSKDTLECTESLGLADCTQKSGSWLWNLEGEARVSDDASNWRVAVSNQMHYSGQYVNAIGKLQAFSGGGSSPNDGPDAAFLQQPAGQKLVFYIDGPGPPNSINGAPIYSLTTVFDFKVQYTNVVTHFTRSVSYYVKIVIAPGGQLDRTNSKAGYGNISLNF